MKNAPISSVHGLGLLLSSALGCDEPAPAQSTEAPPAEEVAQPAAANEAAANEAAVANEAAEATEAQAPETAQIGQPAPDFTLPNQDGEEVHLADLRGKIVVLEWTNPDCPYVQRHYQAQTMLHLNEAFADQDVVWLAINSSHTITAEAAQEWRSEQSLPYPILLDPSGEVGHRYNARTTPHMYVIDAEGVLRYAGAIDSDPRGREEAPTNYVRQAIEALQAGEPVPSSEIDPYGCTVKYEDAA